MIRGSNVHSGLGYHQHMQPRQRTAAAGPAPALALVMGIATNYQHKHYSDNETGSPLDTLCHYILELSYKDLELHHGVSSSLYKSRIQGTWV